MATAPKVAVVGGGLAGAVCSSSLARRGVQVTVFDMGRQSPGGRASTRLGPGQQQYDYGCQFLCPSSPHTKRLVGEWTTAGVVAEWRPRHAVYDVARGALVPRELLPPAELQAAGRGFFNSLDGGVTSGPLYVGVPTMSALVSHLLGGHQPPAGSEGAAGASPGTLGSSGGAGTSRRTDLRLNVRVRRARFAEGRWLLGGEQRTTDGAASGPGGGLHWDPDLGAFDALVLTDSQVGRPGSPGYIAFEGASPSLTDLTTKMAALARVPLFTLMLGWDKEAAAAAGARGGSPLPLPSLPADVVNVVGGSGIQWLARDSSKPGRLQADGAECWVALTTPEFARQLLDQDSGEAGSGPSGPGAGPPPATPEYRARKAEQILEAVRRDLSALTGSQPFPRPTFLSAHRWSSAYVAAPLGSPAVWEAAGRWAACGDYCPAEGPGADAAVVSGLAAADAVSVMLGLPSAAS